MLGLSRVIFIQHILQSKRNCISQIKFSFIKTYCNSSGLGNPQKVFSKLLLHIELKFWLIFKNKMHDSYTSSLFTVILLLVGRGPHSHLLLVGMGFLRYLSWEKEFSETHLGRWNIVDSFISLEWYHWATLVPFSFVLPSKKGSCGRAKIKVSRVSPPYFHSPPQH